MGEDSWRLLYWRAPWLTECHWTWKMWSTIASPLEAENVATPLFHKLLGMTFRCLRLQYRGRAPRSLLMFSLGFPAKVCGGGSHFMRVSQIGPLSRWGPVKLQANFLNVTMEGVVSLWWWWWWWGACSL